MLKKIKLVIIFSAHILLLAWMFYALSEGGSMKTQEVLLHFLGMSIYGALLIRLSALSAKRDYQKHARRKK